MAEELEQLTLTLQVTNLPGLIERRCQSGGRLSGRDPVGSRCPPPCQPRVQVTAGAGRYGWCRGGQVASAPASVPVCGL